jgi:hypothetical protein
LALGSFAAIENELMARDFQSFQIGPVIQAENAAFQTAAFRKLAQNRSKMPAGALHATSGI